MTDGDLAILKASAGQRVKVICADGITIEGEVVTVSPDDVLLDAVLQPDGTLSYASVLSVGLDEINAVTHVLSKG